ncbi:hypothetical protein AAF712_004755 [Marasmius tenuissimus]|uniref:Uncharacterized protein n=1 Tax=Marasmius tenuissimus TaxID=585030 RepID=A0ABR3A3I0_9AGAR
MSWPVISRHRKDEDPWLSLLDGPFVLDDSMDLVRQTLKSASSAIRVGYAFTMSDIKTIIIPVTCYGLLSAPETPGIHTMSRLLIWVWLYLLQFCAANQMYSPEEDCANKPYRPIPAGLMSVESTYFLRWSLVPICLYISWQEHVLIPGLLLTGAFWAYNEGNLDARWYSKNLLNAIGIVSWDVGASKIASAGFASLNEIFWMAPLLSLGLIWTTIHVQDFRDEIGDRMQGRITFPTLLPEGSRYITSFVINAWTLALGWYWGLSTTSYWLFLSLGAYLSLRIFFQRTEGEDKVSLRVYMVWLTIARTLPFLQLWAEGTQLLLPTVTSS